MRHTFQLRNEQRTWIYSLQRWNLNGQLILKNKIPDSLSTGEIQIKDAIRLYFTSVRMVIIQQSENNKCRHGCKRKMCSNQFLVEIWTSAIFWKIVWKIITNLKLDLPYNSIPSPGNLSKWNWSKWNFHSKPFCCCWLQYVPKWEAITVGWEGEIF